MKSVKLRLILITLYKLYSIPILLASFLRPDVGKEYGVGLYKKIFLFLKFIRNTVKIQTASDALEHLEMAKEILQIPPSMKGDIIECGCFKGGSSANLSLVCSLVGRKLVVCDSFAGLPEPDTSDKHHYAEHSSTPFVYERGQYAGALDEVKENITKYGSVNVCEFVPGFFEDTLPKLKRNYVFAYIDVDLFSSLKTCLINIWPSLNNGCKLFSHEAKDIPFTALFFKDEWWQMNIGCQAPGFVGTGTGLPLVIKIGCNLGYTSKKHETLLLTEKLNEVL